MKPGRAHQGRRTLAHARRKCVASGAVTEIAELVSAQTLGSSARLRLGGARGGAAPSDWGAVLTLFALRSKSGWG
jgi:hypothetical protein